MTSHRTPVETRGRRVPGLYSRTLEDGREVFEYRGRLNGRVVTRKLEARTRSEAVAEAERLRSQARNEGSLLCVDRRLTVERLAEMFGAAVDADPTYSPRTREDLHSRLKKHVVPGLRGLRVFAVDAVVIRSFARSLPFMRAKTHGNIVSVCSTMFAWAVAEGLAIENPVARARERFPRDLRRTDDEPFEPRHSPTTNWQRRSRRSATRTARSSRSSRRREPASRRRSGSGSPTSTCRRVRGRSRGQLDADRTIRRTKTPAGMVTVPLSRAAVAIVKERRRALMRTSFSAASSDAFVFTGIRGQPFSRRNALRAWQKATEAILDEPVRLHDLRTTLASRLAANLVDVPTAQALLRHKRPSTTLDVYTGVQGDAAARLERMRKALDA
ncbi:MAG TPA: tyrosine-type recombinase/integrase [Gaiellaceae bacterium]|nr:tyrosine-type recombinase/integrase [Gaiellaceae bacterium]